MQKETGASLKQAAEETTSRPRGVSVRHLMVLAVCAIAVYAVDQGSKAWALHSLTDGHPRRVLGSLLKFNLVANPGAAFSFATNATWILTVIAAVVVLAVLFSARRLHSMGWSVALGFVVGGALGNLTDRFTRPPGGGRGAVVDFLQLPHWPIFNVADSAICTAAVVIVVLALRGIGLDGRVHRDDERPQRTLAERDV